MRYIRTDQDVERITFIMAALGWCSLSAGLDDVNRVNIRIKEIPMKKPTRKPKPGGGKPC